MYKLKIVFVGPAGSGKTTIANFLADMPENIGAGAYRPTQGVRILEYETLVGVGTEAPTKTQIELWDCGSNQKYDMCWPAIQNEAHGICFIIDAANPSDIPEVEKLFNILVIQTGLNRNRCMLIAHHKKSIDREMKHLSRLGSSFPQVYTIHANVEENDSRLLSDFNNFYSSILAGLKDTNEQEELSIMNMEKTG
ncbi:intraflagellar transport protein 22 homolog [Anabrus simplex]|uniref:intraflagellar transport protein 22 homolog n=1 Tax=Anabrus simplex TaxID=316456 RepID=UPI0035A3A83F